MYETINRGHELPADKARHYIVGSLIAVVALIANRAVDGLGGYIEIIFISGAVFAVALAWEVWQAIRRKRDDRKYIEEAAKDVLATVLGAVPLLVPLALG